MLNCLSVKLSLITYSYFFIPRQLAHDIVHFRGGGGGGRDIDMQIMQSMYWNGMSVCLSDFVNGNSNCR